MSDPSKKQDRPELARQSRTRKVAAKVKQSQHELEGEGPISAATRELSSTEPPAAAAESVVEDQETG